MWIATGNGVYTLEDIESTPNSCLLLADGNYSAIGADPNTGKVFVTRATDAGSATFQLVSVY